MPVDAVQEELANAEGMELFTVFSEKTYYIIIIALHEPSLPEEGRAGLFAKLLR